MVKPKAANPTSPVSAGSQPVPGSKPIRVSLSRALTARLLALRKRNNRDQFEHADGSAAPALAEGPYLLRDGGAEAPAANLAGLDAAIAQSKERIDRYDQRIAAATARVAEIDREQATVAKRIQETRQKSAAIQQEIKTVRGQIEGIQPEIKTVRGQIAAIEAEQRALAAEEAELLARLEALGGGGKAAAAGTGPAPVDPERARELAKLRAELDAVRSELKGLEAEKGRLLAKLKRGAAQGGLVFMESAETVGRVIAWLGRGAARGASWVWTNWVPRPVREAVGGGLRWVKGVAVGAGRRFASLWRKVVPAPIRGALGTAFRVVVAEPTKKAWGWLKNAWSDLESGWSGLKGTLLKAAADPDEAIHKNRAEEKRLTGEITKVEKDPLGAGPQGDQGAQGASATPEETTKAEKEYRQRLEEIRRERKMLEEELAPWRKRAAYLEEYDAQLRKRKTELESRDAGYQQQIRDDEDYCQKLDEEKRELAAYIEKARQQKEAEERRYWELRDQRAREYARYLEQYDARQRDEKRLAADYSARIHDNERHLGLRLESLRTIEAHMQASREAAGVAAEPEPQNPGQQRPPKETPRQQDRAAAVVRQEAAPKADKDARAASALAVDHVSAPVTAEAARLQQADNSTLARKRESRQRERESTQAREQAVPAAARQAVAAAEVAEDLLPDPAPRGERYQVADRGTVQRRRFRRMLLGS